MFRIDDGSRKIVIDGKSQTVESDDALLVPAGARHNLINTDDNRPLKLYTLYGTPNHRDGVEFPTRAEAEASGESSTGATTE